MPSLELAFLGPPQIMRLGRPVPLRAAKALALLVYLALRDTAVSRARLAALLWAASDEEAARKNLRNHLWLIRQALGDDALVSEGDTITLAPGVWSDLVAFSACIDAGLGAASPAAAERLAAGLALWRGPLLAGVRLVGAAELEIWLIGERERLCRLFVRGALHQIARLRAAGAWQPIADLASLALADDGTQEELARALMEANARLGRRQEALQTYERLRAALSRDLGLNPQPETDALRSQIQSERLESSAPRGLLGHPPARQVGAPRPLSVGRRAELEAMHAALARACQGALQLVEIVGDLGVGKSTLWERFADALPVEAMRIATVCLNSTQPLPFAPIIRLLRSLGVKEYLTGRPDLLASPWVGELARLAPEIGPLADRHALAAPLEPGEESLRLYEALTYLLASLPTRPLVLFCDDLHWIDRATLDWLTYLVDRLADEPLMLVYAYRPERLNERLQVTLVEWRRRGCVTHLALPPLGRDDLLELAGGLGIEPARVAELHRRSGGNPYVFLELSRVADDALPSGLGAIVAARVERLPGEAQRVLQAAAVIEPEISFALLQGVSQLGVAATLDAVDRLLAEHLLVERGGTLAFAQPFIAVAVRDQLSQPRRHALHQRAAELLRASHTPPFDAVAGQLMGHLAQAGLAAEAAGYGEQAAWHAFGIGAMHAACDFFQRAYELAPTPQRLLGLGQAVTHLPGRLDEGRARMAEAARLLDQAGERLAAADAAIRLADSHLFSEEGEAMVRWATWAAERLDGMQRPPELACALAFVHGSGAMLFGQLDLAEHYLNEATQLAAAHSLTSPLAVRSWAVSGTLCLKRGAYRRAQDYFERADTVAEVGRNYYQQTLIRNQLAHTSQRMGDLPAALDHVERGLALAERHGILRPRQYLYSTRGEIALASGDTTDARNWLTQALGEAERYHNSPFALQLRANLARLAVLHDGAEP